MQKSQGRFALLAGVSIAALSATPALAAPHDSASPGLHPAPAPITDTLTLCGVGASCFYGDIEAATPVATAAVSNFFISQTDSGPTIALSIVNNGSAEIGGIASATGVAGNATANANVGFDVLYQVGTATTGNASVAIDNESALLIDAVALASGTGSAKANAHVLDGIAHWAVAEGDGTASANLTNNGSLIVEASAVALAGGFASANASVGSQGIFEGAYAEGTGDANITLANNGSINIGADAVAHGSAASAFASASGAMYQSATANSGNASVTLNNAAGATFDIHAAASALATDGIANATADVDVGIYQFASASSGNATANLTNDGSIGINAAATANGKTSAFAYATVDNAISQTVSANNGDATASITNSNSIQIEALAKAVATGFASAYASIDTGIFQEATADTGNAVVSLVNATGTGTGAAPASIDIGAVASATGATASASVSMDSGISQVAEAFGGGNASALISNAGSIDIHGTANAVASVGDANASVENESAFYQYVSAETGNASASLDNSGTIDISANANASAGSFAFASASVDGGILQYADADSGDANASILNDGTIDIAATAKAAGFSAEASAFVDTGVSQTAFADGGNATAVITNNGTLNITADASAAATGGFVEAFASVDTGIYQSASAFGGSALASIVNSGTVTIAANAKAVGVTEAIATASVDTGIYQYANGTGAKVSLDNSGTIAISAHALASAASGSAFADAYATPMIYQQATGSLVTLTNTGTITGSAVATAVAAGFAEATATVTGISQSANGTSANAQFNNSGTVTLNATANAAGSSAEASAYVNGVTQNVSGTTVANATASNSGTVDIKAVANATAATGDANAQASVWSGVDQFVRANGTTGVANALIDNSGTFDIAINANANGAVDASADASGEAFFQAVSAADATATIDNSGTINIDATANAVAGTGAADADVYVAGYGQNMNGGNDAANIDNSGTINMVARAVATGGTFANATATVTGIFQNMDGSGTQTVNVDNSGTIAATASAIASAASGSAYASVIGDDIGDFSSATGVLDIVNSGTFSAKAIAQAPGTASAHAVVLSAQDFGTAPAVLTGSITNSGNITAIASAAGGPVLTTAVGTATTPGSVAQATGIFLQSAANNMTVTNSGAINVDAITANGGSAIARGVFVTNNGTSNFGPEVFTFTNDGGSMRVRESTDGGATWHRGMAIDVASAPNNSVINLLGAGNIYGNVDVQAGDVINVQSGTTYFDGIINPEFVPAGGFTEANLDTGISGEGTLNIDTGGNLELADPRITGDPTMYDGPAYAIVDTLNMGADGTLTFQLQPAAGGTQAVGTYPQVYADTVNLDGALVADIAAPGGIFDNSYFWDNVIDANVRNGTFASCGLAAPYATTPLLSDLTCTYDANNNVDLGLTRVAFNAVAGLTFNQNSVATGIECLYDDLGASGLAATAMDPVVADLFKFDAADYAAALDQLSGAAYAGYLQSFGSLGYHYNSILDRATDCEVPALAGSALECRTAPMHVWAQVDYQYRKKDGDVELASSKSDRWSAMLGFDVNVGPQAVIGVSVGKVWNDVDFRDQGDSTVRGDGWQAGLYGVYDPGAFYIKALGSYSSFNGDSTRHIDFTPFGGTTAGTLTGSPDVRLWTLGLHGGYRIPVSPTSVITPFVNYDYTDAKLKSFQEGGNTGAELTVNGGSHHNSWLTGGVKWAGQIGSVVPEVKVGYRYMFGEKRASFNADFLDSADCNFDIVSASEKRGAIVAGLTIGGKLGMADLRIGYEGAYNGDVTEHAGFLKVVIPLGAAAAPPPPPPPPPAPPPPPPPPATQTCADGTVILATAACPAPPPPPPPPPPAPERG